MLFSPVSFSPSLFNPLILPVLKIYPAGNEGVFNSFCSLPDVRETRRMDAFPMTWNALFMLPRPVLSGVMATSRLLLFPLSLISPASSWIEPRRLPFSLFTPAAPRSWFLTPAVLFPSNRDILILISTCSSLTARSAGLSTFSFITMPAWAGTHVNVSAASGRFSRNHGVIILQSVFWRAAGFNTE